MPGKSWNQLSSAYRARLSRAGITQHDYETRSPALKAKRQAARGHAVTPERPERANRNPQKYAMYLASRDSLFRAVIAKKDRAFGDRIRFNAKRSADNVKKYRPTIANMRRFLATDDYDEFIESITDNDGRLTDDWAFIGYH